MADRPILFSAPMVNAILHDLKFMTRRVAKPRGRNSLLAVEEDGDGTRVPRWTDSYITDPGNRDWLLRDAAARPGDRLWVRETIQAYEDPDGLDHVRYMADGAIRPIENTAEAADRWVALNHYGRRRGAVVPAIHMPRWACRMRLQVTDVRVERLRDITAEDATAEGVFEPSLGDLHLISPEHMGPLARAQAPPLVLWEFLWRSINGDASWDANPLVFVYSFTRVTP